MEFAIIGHKYGVNHRIRNLIGHAAVKHLGDITDCGSISLIDMVGDIVFVVRIKIIKAIHLLLADFARQIIRIRRIVLCFCVASHNRTDLIHIKVIAIRTKGPAVPAFRKRILPHIVYLIQKRRNKGLWNDCPE